MSIADARKQEAFVKLKLICVPILEFVSLTPASAGKVDALLRQLLPTLEAIPMEVVTGHLLHYAFFPVSQILKVNTPMSLNSHQHVLEAAMAVINAIVRAWLRLDGGFSNELLIQIWLVCVLVLGGPIDPLFETQMKGKGIIASREVKLLWDESTQRTTLKTLNALLEPVQKITVDLPVKPESLFSSKSVPASPNEKYAPASSEIPVTILAHTLTTLLDLSRKSSDHHIRLLALQALQHLIVRFLANFSDPSRDLMPQFLPGIISALIRIVTGVGTAAANAGGEKSTVLELAVDVVGDSIISALGDMACAEVLERLRKMEAKVERLEEICIDETALTQTTVETSGDQGGRVIRSPTWLTATASQLHIALVSIIVSIRNHHAVTVRLAFVRLSARLLADCSQTLEGRSRDLLLGELALFSQDDWPEVRLKTVIALQSFPRILPSLIPILEKALIGLPQTILSHGDDETRMLSATQAIRGLAEALERSPLSNWSPFDNSRIGVERWSWSLLTALELGCLPLRDTPGQGRAAGESAPYSWITPPTSLYKIESTSATPRGMPVGDFPTIPLRYIPSVGTTTKLFDAIAALGSAASSGGEINYLFDHFGMLATRNSSSRIRSSAWWIFCAIVTGLSRLQSRQPPRARLTRIARNVVQIVCEFDAVADDIEVDSDPDLPSIDGLERSNLVPVDRFKGTAAISTLLDGNKIGSSQSSLRKTVELHISFQILSTCLVLRALASASAILQIDFRAELLPTLYLILSHLSPASHPILREHAEVALRLVAFHSGYASVANLVLDNVDYVINAVSQRLTLSRLDPRAPLVLVTVVRLVGEPIVPMVRDVVDEIFDALDSFHAYDEVAAGLLGILDALMRAMSVGAIVDTTRPLSHKFRPEPEATKDLASFADWYRYRNEMSLDGDSTLPSNVSRDATGAFVSTSLRESEEQTNVQDDTVTATRSQVVCAAILSKSLHFLTHSSPFLRARILSLFASGLPILSGTRQSDLLPIVNRVWPYALNRLTDEEPYVVLEACVLVEALARHVGDFMSRRVLKDAWPRMRDLLAAQEVRDRTSPLAGRTTFSTSHRLYCSMLSTMRYIVTDVPLDENSIWELCLLFRRFLPASIDPSLQATACELYQGLFKVNPEAVWLALEGAVGQIGGLPKFLLRTDLDLRANVEVILVK